MFKLDNNFLIELGLGDLPPVEKNKMLAHIYETLEMRVGMKLAEQMSNEQLDEFEGYINKQDEAGALKWLESNFPNYKQVVAEELEKLKGEIQQVAPQIVAQAAQAAAAQPQQSQTIPQPQQPQVEQQTAPLQQPQSSNPAAQPQQPAQPGAPVQQATPPVPPQPQQAPPAQNQTVAPTHPQPGMGQPQSPQNPQPTQPYQPPTSEPPQQSA